MANVLQLRCFEPDAIAGERRLLADTARQRTVVLQRQSTTRDCVTLFGIALERLRRAHALDETHEADLALRDACTWACAAELGGRYGAGTVTVAGLDEQAWRADADGMRLTPGQWIDATILAYLAHDVGARAVFVDEEMFALCAIGPFAAPSALTAEPFWLPYGRAIIALIAADPRAANYAREALQLMSRCSVLDPAGVQAVDRPLLECVAALAQGERQGWGDRIRRAAQAFHDYYARPSHNQLVPGYCALGITAIAKLARERGSVVDVDSPYIRRDWISNDSFAIPAARVALQAGPLATHGAREIRWWFDLAGVPPGRRSHRLGQRNGDVVATYAAAYSEHGPRVGAEFSIDERGPALLDAGELMLASDLHASRATDGADSPDLREAVEALDALLALVPRGASAVPAQAFTTPRGQALYAGAAGRFERARLDVIRREYARLLSKPTDSQPDPRAAALAWTAIVQAAVEEMLEQLPNSPEAVRALRPRDADFEKAFVEPACNTAREAYAALWERDVEVTSPRGASCTGHVHVAPAGMLVEDNELSWHFPGGYRAVAKLLDPHRVWVAWKYVKPGEKSGMSYDGLVWCDDHWAWFPKPYRVLAALIKDGSS